MNINDIFNEKSINIFTDASIMQLPNREYMGAPGYIVVYKDEVIERDCVIIANTTNNNSEIKAIRMGVMAALKYKNACIFPNIRIFSDSLLCIRGLREWIYRWKANPAGTMLISSSGTAVANQDIFLEIANYIVMNNLEIEFFHQRGHISLANPSSVIIATDDFNKFNYGYNADIELVKQLSYYNNMVDEMTRSHLQAKYSESKYIFEDACRFNLINKIDLGKYYELTHRDI